MNTVSSESVVDTVDAVGTEKYELIVLFGPGKGEAGYASDVSELKKIFEEHGATVFYEEILGERTLAYRIKSHKKGYYVFFNLNCNPEVTAALKEAVKLQPGVLRSMLLRLPDGYSVEKVQHDNAKILSYLKSLDAKRPQRKKMGVPPKRMSAMGPLSLRPVPKEGASAEDVARTVSTMKKSEEKSEEKPAAETLRSVEKELDRILENPDIDLT